MADQGEAIRALASRLTGSEARELADHLAGAETFSQAMKVISQSRRDDIRDMLRDAGLAPPNRDVTIAVLRAVEGAHAHATSITPVWTAPRGLVQSGQMTASIQHLVTAARESVTCSTFNFQRSSALWHALRDIACRPGARVRVYVDTDAADESPAAWKPSTIEIARELRGAVVLRTARQADGSRPRNHAKFVVIDHQFLLVTSANFSASAELHNVELGLRIDDPILAQGVENQMQALESELYERVDGSRWPSD